jgi:hypothetical protein
MSIAEAAARQKPGTDYGALNSLVTKLKPETRSNAQLTAEEHRNLQAYLEYKTIQPHQRPAFQVPGFKLHRHGFIHLPALCGTAGIELDHTSMQGRFDEIEDVIVKGDRVWSVFTLRARHVGPLYRQRATNQDLAITEMCCLRYQDGKLAEGWFLGDEVSICRQIGIGVTVSPAPVTATVAPTLTASPFADAADIVARQKPGTAYGSLKSLITRLAPGTRATTGLSDEPRVLPEIQDREAERTAELSDVHLQIQSPRHRASAGISRHARRRARPWRARRPPRRDRGRDRQGRPAVVGVHGAGPPRRSALWRRADRTDDRDARILRAALRGRQDR